MMDFRNISEILDLLMANLGILAKSMTSERFPHAKPFENKKNEKLFPERLSPEKLFPVTDKNGLGEKFLEGNIFWGEGFPCVRISEICPDFGISGIVQLPGYL